MLARERRLRAGRDWDALFRGGFGVGGPLLSLRVLATPGRRRAGVSVGKKVGGAVTRNLVKRRIRALLLEVWDQLPQADIGVLVRAPAAAAEFADLQSALSELAGRAAGKIEGGGR
ncbi:MAG TPA: ribonuclease P protein component [Armatimonadota bacterium]